jgi:4-aminobutyrate aminotransferase-like enzyme
VDDRWPIFWKRALGSNVEDVDGNVYLDMTAAFAVMGVGHTNPRVVAALRKQAGKLLHGMGDVHPHELKVRLAQRLVQLTFGRWKHRGKALFTNSGFEAVEAALKTAAIHTGRRGVIAFQGGYHGLGYGALDATSRSDFRKPFQKQLGHFTVHLPYGRVPARLPGRDIGAVLVEPIQGRAGVIIPPGEFLPALRAFCDKHGLLLILDEIFTGFGRTGRWFACEHASVVPDLICVGKGMTGGFPISACIGKSSVMDSWPRSTGEAIHTSTFLGNPLGCAMALAAIGEIEDRDLVVRSDQMGRSLLARLSILHPRLCVRGRGLLIGIELSSASECWRVVQALLGRGVIVLGGGTDHNVLTLTPPLVVTQRQLDYFMAQLPRVL